MQFRRLMMSKNISKKMTNGVTEVGGDKMRKKSRDRIQGTAYLGEKQERIQYRRL